MPQLRSRRQCRNKAAAAAAAAAAATPDSPSSSGDLAADLAPGLLLLDTDPEGLSSELDASDPPFEPNAEEGEPLTAAATSGFVPAPASLTTNSKTALHLQPPGPHADAPMDIGQAGAGLSAIASRICTSKSGVSDSSAPGTNQHAALAPTRTVSNAPVEQDAAAQQNAQKAGQDLLAPGGGFSLIRVSNACC